MTHVIIIVGRASTISAQLAAIQSLGLVPSGPKIINSDGGSKSRQHEQHDPTFTGGQIITLGLATTFRDDP